MDVSTLTKQIANLSVTDRERLFDSIWSSLAEDGWQPKLSKEMRNELDRRIESLDADPENVMTWEQVEARVRKKK